MSNETAFQADAFQNDAFQVGIVASTAGTGNPSYEQRFFTDLESGNRRFATASHAMNTEEETKASSIRRRSDGWRRQPPG